MPSGSLRADAASNRARIIAAARVAIAHGIELPDVRERAGKPRRGSLELHAEPRGGQVAIEVRDDGGGVAADALAEGLRRGSLVDVLAEAGFTTAEGVSEIAGRGVGLDAVKRQVESVGGSLAIDSEGATQVVWGEGLNYKSPGSIWYAQGR